MGERNYGRDRPVSVFRSVSLYTWAATAALQCLGKLAEALGGLDVAPRGLAPLVESGLDLLGDRANGAAVQVLDPRAEELAVGRNNGVEVQPRLPGRERDALDGPCVGELLRRPDDAVLETGLDDLVRAQELRPLLGVARLVPLNVLDHRKRLG